MPVTLSCTGCQATLRVRDELAGKKVKCPKCATVLVVPAGDEDATEVLDLGQAVTHQPKGNRGREAVRRQEDHEEERPRKRPRRDEEEEEDRRGRTRGEDEDDRRARKKSRRDEDEEESPRRAAARRDEEEEEEERPRKNKKKGRRDEAEEGKGGTYEPCPRCGAEDPKRVAWTAWGSFYGPAMFSHVRCQDCGYAYNGKTGGSNLVPALGCVTVPLLGIVALLGLIVYMLAARDYLPKFW